MTAAPSSSQTVGPFFSIGLEHLCWSEASAAPSGLHCFAIRGRVLDAHGAPVPDAMLEVWHANASGSYAEKRSAAERHQGFLRVATDEQGNFSFKIVKPGRVPFDRQTVQAPHLVVLVFMRGLLRHLLTRMYFPETEVNAADPVLQLVPEDRRHTLVAQPDPRSASTLSWDIRLQGENETVFFTW